VFSVRSVPEYYPEEAERPPLEAVTRQGLVKT
jgi:hypothetical protein